MLKALLPDDLKVNISIDSSIDNIRLKSNPTTNETIRFPKRSFFYIILGFTQSHLGSLCGIERFVQLIPGT